MHFDNMIRQSRNRQHHLLSILFHHVLWNIPALIRVFYIVLFLSGCCPAVLPEAEHPLIVKQFTFSVIHSPSDGSTLDILTFEDDRLQRLDSYQRIDDFTGSTAYAESTCGPKIFFFCTSKGRSIYQWAEINSYSSLKKLRFDLENERRIDPTRTGECRLEAGSDKGEVVMKPLVSEVCIESISCDFSGTPYSGTTITDVCAYLTNVNGSYGLTDHDYKGPERIINQGRLSRSDLTAFKEPDIIFSSICESLTSNTLHPQISFLCYPNPGDGSSIGNPCTRLVIEGKIDGQTYYWPININQDHEKEECGIGRNCRYIFDILIRRKGTSDPDIAIDLKRCDIKFELKPWEEKKEYGISF